MTSQPLPANWLDQDLGPAGIATYSNGQFSVTGAGSTGGTADASHFAYQALTGDGTIVARVVSTQNTGYQQYGIMVRETLDASSRDVIVWGSGGTLLKYRSAPGGDTSYQSGPGFALGYFLKLVRSGNVFTGYMSSNALDWYQVGTPVTVPMASTAYFGMFAGNGQFGQSATTTFDNVSITSSMLTPPLITAVSGTTGPVGSAVTITGTGFGTSQNGSAVLLNDAPMTINSWSDTSLTFTLATGATTGILGVTVAPTMNSSNVVPFTITSQPLPSPWLDRDIGIPLGGTSGSPAGSATYSGGTFTISGSGGLGSTADSGHFMYQLLTGDGSITARVTSYQQTSYQQIGLMIRETLNNNSRDVLVQYTPNISALWDRPSTGGSTTTQGGSGPSTQMYWLKLIRNGNTFAGFIGSDGGTWTQVGNPVTVWMGADVDIGIIVSSQISGSLETATFDNVTVTNGTTPYVASVSPTKAGVGTAATISGSHFGSSPGGSTIAFNGVAATSITSWSDSQIVAIVPSTVPGGWGPLTVTVNSIVSNANVMFDSLNPIITAVSPPSGAINGTITITGTGLLNGTQSSHSALFNGVAGNVTAWSDTSITVGVPFGATSGPLTVNLDGVVSNSVPFTIEGAPAITGVSPGAGYIGSTVAITGSGFGAVQSNSTMNFNGANATVTHWTDTEIDVTVPARTSTGPVGVTVAGLNAQGPQFVVDSTVQVTDSAGNLTNYTSTMLGGTWHTIASQGSGCSSCTVRGSTQEDYDWLGNMLHQTDALGHTITYGYDGNGNVASQSEPLDTNTNVNWTYTYNSLGEVLTATDPLGNKTTNTYDTHGNLLTVTTPKPDANTAASVTQFGYNSLGELTTITDPLNHVTTLTYTPAGLIQTITDAQNNVTTYGYDAHGNRTSVTDAMQHQTTFAYDAGDRLTTITYPDQTTTVFGYDTRGRRTSVTDQNGKQTTYAYDDADRLISVTDAAQHVTQYAYDNENNLSSITDANNHATNFAYDNLGRVKETDFPSGHAETYIYDVIGNLTSKTDRNGNIITYVYDALNRLTHKGYPDSTAVDYVYDLVGKIKQATAPTGTYGFAYDNMGRLIGTTTQYTFLPGQTYSNGYTYDAASNRTGFTAPDGSTNTYVYDTLNRLSTLTNSLTGQFGFGYDTLSRRTSLTRPNNVNTSYTYDNLSRLLSVLHQTGATTIDGASYTLDNAGNRMSKLNQLNGVTENYTYDPIYQLTQVHQVVNGTPSTSESYTYDAVGNRLSSLNVASYSVNSSNELTSSSDGTSYTYDNNGNTLTRTVSGNTTSYAWDFENQLTQVTLPQSGGVVQFKYDPFGRRIQKSLATGTTNYVYDGAGIVTEYDASGSSVARYTQGSGIDEPLAMWRGGALAYYNTDGLGSVTSLRDPSGALAVSYTYDGFGKSTASNGTINNPFRYTGREWDQEAGFYFYRTRYNDPLVGRFLSEDLIRFMGLATSIRTFQIDPLFLLTRMEEVKRMSVPSPSSLITPSIK